MKAEYKDPHQAIIDRCRKGEKAAYNELYQLYAKPMFNIILRIVNNREEAEEILQDGFLAAFKQLQHAESVFLFGPWLKRVVINKALDVLKKRKLNFVEISGHDVQNEDQEADEYVNYDIQAIHTNMVLLPDGYRTILSLFLFEDLSHKEIAELMGISEGTSKSQYARAKKKLIELIQKNINHVG